MLRVFNDTARYVDQGGGKRKGAFAVYLERAPPREPRGRAGGRSRRRRRVWHRRPA